MPKVGGVKKKKQKKGPNCPPTRPYPEPDHRARPDQNLTLEPDHRAREDIRKVWLHAHESF